MNKVKNIKYMEYSLREYNISILPKELLLPKHLSNYHIQNGNLIDESEFELENTLVIKVLDYLNDITKCDVKSFEIVSDNGKIIESVSF